MQPSEQNLQRAAGDTVVAMMVGVVSLLIGLGAVTYASFALARGGLYELDYRLGLALTAACLVAVSGCILAATLTLGSRGTRIAFGAWATSVGFLVVGLGSPSFAAQLATFVSVSIVARRALV